jgi:membrane protein YqaA with SNARE-associated domain
VPVTGEYLWDSTLYLKPEAVPLATLLAWAATMAAFIANYAFGRYLLSHRDKMPMQDEAYHKGQNWVRRYGVWLLLFPFIPLLTAFSVIIAFFNPGMVRFFCAVGLGKLAYYLYHLYEAGILSF